MSEPTPKPAKPTPPVSDLSQVLSHGPAYREAFGQFLGAVLMLVAISKTSRGTLGIAAAGTAVITMALRSYSK
jgi:hypothetical protein